MSMLSHKAPPPACAIVIFGANGDLTKRLIIPALYNLARTNLLPKSLALVGVDHNKKTSEEWTAQLKDFLGQVLAKNNEEIDEALWGQVARSMNFLSGDFEKPETYSGLKDLLEDLDEKQSLNGNVLFYMAVADRFFGTIAGKLGEAGLVADGKGFRRLIVEKPFGHDLASAKALNGCLLQYMKEDGSLPPVPCWAIIARHSFIEFDYWRKRGIVRTAPKHITITDLASLRQIADYRE